MTATATQTMTHPAPHSGRYAEKRIGVIVRNSTPNQIGNYRSQEQEAAALQRIEREGGSIAVYDEQGTSGRDLNKRHKARSLLDDIEAGRLDGLYAFDLKRLTRDEYGADAGTIARRLTNARALLITASRDYRLWLKDDLRLYRIETAIAGGEVLDIRDTFYDGLFGRAKVEPFFRNVPPFGYKTRIVEQRGTRKGEPTRLRRVPEKDPAHAETMAELVRLFGVCLSLGEVAARLNATPAHRPPILRGEQRGGKAMWSAQRIREMLQRPYYYGVWRFGHSVDDYLKKHPRRHRSTIWDKSRDMDAMTHECPDLAYWTKAEADAWLARLSGSKWRASPARLETPYDRPLRGVLVCATCGAELISAGAQGYQCPAYRLGKGAATCSQPQKISHSAAMRVLWELFPRAIAEWTTRRERLKESAATTTTADDLRSQLRLRQDKLAVMTNEWYGPDAPNTVPRPVRERMAALEDEITALEDKVTGAERDAEVSAQAAKAISRIEANPQEALDAMTPDERAAAYRLVFSGVAIRATGWGAGRTYEVVSYHNLLTTSTEGTSAYTASCSRRFRWPR